MPDLPENDINIEKLSLWPAFFFCLIQLCTVADNAALMNASSAISATFKSNVSELQTANIMFPLMGGTIMVAGGFLGNTFGWKRLIQYGLAILIAGELLCAISPNIIIFIYCARVLVGTGAGLSIPALLGLITIMYKKKQQAFVFGLVAGTIALASVVAPVVSGYIIVYLNWQSAFILLVVLFVVTLFYISFCVNRDRVLNSKKSFDYIALFMLFSGLCLLIMGLSHIIKWGLIYPASPPFTLFNYSPCLFFIIAGIAFIVLLIKWERYREKQKGTDFVFIPRAFIMSRQIISSISMNAFIYLILGGAIFLILIFLQIFFDANAITTGFVMAVFAVGMIPFSILTPLWGGNYSPRAICIVGIIVSSVGCFVLGYGISPLHGIGMLFYLGLLILGMGTGLVASLSSFIVVASLKSKKLASQSSGIQGAMRNIGQAVSIAVIGAIFLTAFTISVKSNLVDLKINNPEFKQKVLHMREIPTTNRKVAEKILKSKYELSPETVKIVLDLSRDSSITAFRVTYIVLGVILLLFIFLARSICSEKLKVIQKSQEEL